MKLFGQDLFTFKKPEPEPGEMYDFAQNGVVRDGRNNNSYDPIAYVLSREDVERIQDDAAKQAKKKKRKAKKLKKSEEPLDIHFTAKGIFEMKALNAHEFFIKTDPTYVAEQVNDLQAKLELVNTKKKKSRKKDRGEEILQSVGGGVYYAQREIESMIERLQTRAKLPEVEAIINKYPHTTTELIVHVLGLDNELRCQKATDFVPDFPKEAINAMKEYNEMCIKITGKKTHFYVIANQKDFEVKNRRRDPILLAQSPFGFFWQILGAWDKEMIYLGDL